MISSQTFDNHKLTQGVRSHSIPPVRAAEGGAARRAAEGEGSGSRHLPDRQPFESMVCSGPEQSQHVSEAMHHKVLSTLKTNFLIFFFPEELDGSVVFLYVGLKGMGGAPCSYPVQNTAKGYFKAEQTASLPTPTSLVGILLSSIIYFLCSAQLDVY